MMINKKQIAYNRTKRSQRPQYIVIHDTGNPGRGANANSHFEYFNGGDRNSSADFFVDDTQVLQVNDYNIYYTWHCGDGKGKYGITNGNSVGIELCINSDGNYSDALQNTIALTKQLMKELNIPFEKVVRHYDASRKNCPATMSARNWSAWKNFKSKLSEEDFDMEQLTKLQESVSALQKDVAEIKNKMVYAWVDDNMPGWAKPTVQKLMNKGLLKGDPEGKLNLDETMLRILVINDRAGIYGD